MNLSFLASADDEAQLERARLEHAHQIADLIDMEARKNQMLARPVTDIYRQILNFVVVTKHDHVISSGSLEIFSEHLGEVRSLVTHADHRGNGHAREIVLELKKIAKQLGLRQLIALTYVPEFFEQLGFDRTQKSMLPEKVWVDCVRCPFFNRCNEIAVSFSLN